MGHRAFRRDERGPHVAQRYRRRCQRPVAAARGVVNGCPRSFPQRPRTSAGFRASTQRSSRVLLECLEFLPGIGTATPSDVVTGLAKRLSALVLVLAMVATASGTAFAQNRHPICEAKQHDCGQPANIPSCCCGDLGAPRDAGTPAQSRTDVASGPLNDACAAAIQISSPGSSRRDRHPGVVAAPVGASRTHDLFAEGRVS